MTGSGIRNSSGTRRGRAAALLTGVSIALSLSLAGPVPAAASPVATVTAPRARPLCGDVKATIVGTPGDDHLVGTRGPDVIVAGRGDDVVAGRGGRDLICGRSGDDVIVGGIGADVLRGGRGSDRLVGGLGGDELRGGRGSDSLLGGVGADTLRGEHNGDTLRGGPGDDFLDGGRATDDCEGGSGFNRLTRCEVTRNLPPSATDDTTSTDEDSAVGVNVLGNDIDPDGDDLLVTAVNTAGTKGAVTVIGGGTRVRYDPRDRFESLAAGASGSDTFRYRVADGQGGADTATVRVTIAGRDDAPRAVDDAETVPEDSGPTTIDARANDTDVDGGPKTITGLTQPAHGSTVITNGGDDLTYEPDADYCNAPGAEPVDTFTYTLNGGDSATVSVTVTCADDAAVAVDDTATVTEDDSATAVDVLGNDTDADGDAITIESVTQPDNGTVAITGVGTGLTYQPDADYCNTSGAEPDDTFAYTVNGGDQATVSVTVTCVDDGPTAVDDSATIAMDAPATTIDVLANDTDVDGGPMTVTQVTQPANGTVVITNGGDDLTYRPDAGYCDDDAPDTFTYTLGGGSTATVSVTVPCDVPPTAVDDTATVTEDAAATSVDVLANDTDPDGGPMTITQVTQPANGTVVITNGGDDLTYQPDADFCNAPPGTTTDDFTYTLGGGSIATVTVTVTCVDDDPVAVDDSATVTEDSGATAVNVLANDTDVDGGPKTISSASDPANGTVALTGGSPGARTGLTYAPDPNSCNDPPATSPDTFTYTLNGGSTATVAVTVTCVADAPGLTSSAGPTAYTENGTAKVVDPAVDITNPDGLTITAGSVSITQGSFQAGQDVLDWTDNNLADSITEGASTNQTVLLTGNGTAAQYEAALAAVTYVNTSDNPSTANRTVSFSITTGGGSPSDTIDITVTAVDDLPTAVDDSATVLEDAAATAVGVLGNDTDPDAGPRAISSASDPANGTVTLTGGSPGAHTGLTYQPDPNYCNNPPGTAPDTFTYTLNGGSTGTVSMTVTCVNDAPVADDETFNGANGAIGNTTLVGNDPDDGAPGTPDPTDTAPSADRPHKTISGDITAGDTDIDGPGPLSVTAGTFSTSDGGSVTIQADGDFVFEPAPSTSCTDTSDFFDYTVNDGGTPNLTDTGRVTIAVAGCVWYVDNDDAQGNAGTSEKPFDTLAQAETASGTGHTVFVYDGNGTSTGYAAGINLKANQQLIGEVANLVVSGDTLHAGVAGKRPTLTDTNADVVDLDDSDTVRGLAIDPQGTGGGIAGSSGDTGGGVIDNVTIVDAGTRGTQPGLELDGTTGTFNVSDLTIDNGDANNATSADLGIRLSNAGTVVFAPGSTISVTTHGAKALDLTGTALGTSTFDEVTVDGSGSGGLSLVNTTGTIALGDDVAADISLTTGGAAAAFLLNNAGTVTVGTGGTDSVSATGGPAVDITGAGSFAFDDTDSTNSSTDGINLDSFAAGTFSAGSGSAIIGAAGIGFDINQGNAGVTYDGTINTSAAASRPVEVTNRGGGTVDLNGLVTATGSGVNLATNPSASIRFDGGLTLSTGTNAAFDATGGGTVIVTDPNANGTAPDNTLATTTGVALNVANTTIGAGGMLFRSIASNGAPNGIVLTNTGSNGGVTVTGSGSATQGGDLSGGTIQGTTGSGISLTNTTSASFRNMRLLNTGDSGVNGTQVSGFSFVDGTITGAGDASDENSITFDDSLTSTPNLTGVVTITNNVISLTEAEGIDIENWAGTISNATISNNALSDTGDVATPGSAITLIGSGLPASAASITRATVANNTITDFRAGVGVQVRAGNPNAGGPTGSAGVAGSGTDVIAVTGNSMNGGNGGIGNQPDRFFTGGVSGNGGQGNFNVSNNGTATNRLRNIDCIAIEVQMDGPVTMTSTVQDNFVNANSAVGCAGIAVGTDDPGDLGAGTHTTLISGNNVMGTDGPGIFPIVRDSGSTMIARVLNNTVAAPIASNAARAGIRVDSGSAAGDTTMCLEISGNTTAGSTNSGTATTSPGINLRKQGTDPAVNTFGVEGMAATSSPGVENYVNSLNTSTSGTFGTGGTALLSAQSGFTSCNAP